MKPKWCVKKYMGDDSHSYAVVDKNYIEKGHRGALFWLPHNAVAIAGLNRLQAKSYLQQLKQKQKEMK